MFRGTFLVYSERPGAKRAWGGEFARSSGLGGEGEIESLRFTAVIDFDFVGLGAERFVPCGDGVAAGRKIRQNEAAVVAGDGKIRGPYYGELTLHPWVQVALHGNELLVFIGVSEGRRARGLNLVPLAVYFRERVNIVGERVAVGDSDFLADAEDEDMRGELTALLVEEYGRRGSGARIGGAFGNVHDDVADRVAGTDDERFGKERIGGVHLRAGGLLGKVERFGLCGRAIESDLARHTRSRRSSQ